MGEGGGGLAEVLLKDNLNFDSQFIYTFGQVSKGGGASAQSKQTAEASDSTNG